MATLKQGDRVRKIRPTKDSTDCAPVGHVGTLTRKPVGNGLGGNIHLDNWFGFAGFGNEFELVEETTTFSTVPLTNHFEGLTSAIKIKPGSLYYTTVQLAAEPIKTINLKTKMTNFIKKLTQSAADKTLEKAGFINSCGELTSTGQSALTSLVFQEKKDALVKLAEEVIAEEKA